MRKAHGYFGEARGWKLGDCMVRAVASAALLLAAGSEAAKSQLMPMPRAISQQFSAVETSALNGGANRYPYATLALLYLLKDGSADPDGALYLESIPTASLSSLLLGSSDRPAIAMLLGALQWTPYSYDGFFVQVSWSIKGLTSGARVFRFRTTLLSKTGAFPHPPLESATAVLSSAGSVSFFDPAALL
jgi:hypothetical protein